MLKFTNFRHHGNKGRCEVYFNDPVKLCDPENPLFGLRILAILITQAEKWLILLQLATFRYNGNKGKSKVNFLDTVKLRDLENPLFGARIFAIALIEPGV